MLERKFTGYDTPMSQDEALKNNAIGQFLRARRAELRPEQVGLPSGGNTRRVPGLRREEVALLAGFSFDYYNRLEQGRLVPSFSALKALVNSLLLNSDQHAYLQRLVHASPGNSDLISNQAVGPQTSRLIKLIHSASVVVVGRYLDILAWNSVASALFLDFSKICVQERNFVRMAFLDAEFRSRYVDWNKSAKECVAYLRMEVSRNPSNPRLNALVKELSEKDSDFRTWWNSHQVAIPTCGQKSLIHPAAGLIALDWQMIGCSDDPEQMIYLMSAPAESPVTALLAGWQTM